MPDQFDVLIVSTRAEDRKALMHVLDKLSANVFSCSTLGQAQEALARQTIQLVFCDQRLPDGTYRDLVATRQAGLKTPPVVVTSRVGGWEDYTEATGLGAFDLIPCPLHPTDVELAVIRAMHAQEQKAARATA
jgi:two-component system, NtrC family, response regulator